MSYYNNGRSVKETSQNKTVATATFERGAEIIVIALNHYFGDNYTRNQAVEMMNLNTCNSLRNIVKLVKSQKMKKQETLDYLLEIADEMEAQALVVSMRDELKYEKPKD